MTARQGAADPVNPAKAKLSLGQVLAYAAPGIGMSLLISPFPSLIAAFYAQYTAATAAGIGAALLFIRLADAVIDPAVGYLSDRTKTRMGGRKPWMLGGMAVAVLAFAVVFQPPKTASDLYFAGAMTLYYAAVATLDIPLKSWAGELATDYQQRSRIASYLTFALLAGGFGLLLLPNILSLPALGLAKTSELDRPMMALIGRIGMIMLPVGVLVAVFGAPTGRGVAPTPEARGDFLRSIRANRPFWIMIGADALTQMAWGLTYAILFIALARYFGLGPQISLFIVIATIAQIAAIPACSWASDRVGKHAVWGWSSIASALVSPLVLLFPRHAAPYFFLFSIYTVINSALGTPNMMFPMAMVGDVADYDALKSGQSRNGTYYAFRLLCLKATFAIGNALGFFALALVHYDPKSDTNSAFATWGMLISMAVLPSVLFLGAGIVLLNYPLTSRRHAVIRRRLDRRAARLA